MQIDRDTWLHIWVFVVTVLVVVALVQNHHQDSIRNQQSYDSCNRARTNIPVTLRVLKYFNDQGVITDKELLAYSKSKPEECKK